jgi:hypothetical protein
MALADRIRAAGASVELLVAPFAGRGFDGEPNSFGNQLAEGGVRDFVMRLRAEGRLGCFLNLLEQALRAGRIGAIQEAANQPASQWQGSAEPDQAPDN